MAHINNGKSLKHNEVVLRQLQNVYSYAPVYLETELQGHTTGPSKE